MWLMVGYTGAWNTVVINQMSQLPRLVESSQRMFNKRQREDEQQSSGIYTGTLPTRFDML